MTNLGALLVEQKVATVQQVEEARARQALQGGDLATSLLELGLVSEGALTYALAESNGLTPAPVGELPLTAQSILRLVPGEVALRHMLYPLEERGGALRIAVSQPLPDATREDLEFALGLPLEECGALVFRVRQAIARDYGLPLDRRLLRLVETFEKNERPPAAAAQPVLQGPPDIARLPRPGSLPPDVFTARAEAGEKPSWSDNPERAYAPAPPKARLTHPWMSAQEAEKTGVLVTATVHVGADAIEALERELAAPPPASPPPAESPAETASVPTPMPPGAAANLAPASEAADQTSESEVAKSTTPMAETADMRPAANEPFEDAPAPPSSIPLTTYLGVEELARLEQSAASAPFSSFVPPDTALGEGATSDGHEPGRADTTEHVAAEEPRPRRRTPPPPAEFVMEAAAATAAEVQRKQRKRAAQRPQAALAGWARRSLGEAAALRKPAARRRGPLPVAAAEAALEEASTSEQALAVFFDFARQYFEYAAFFVVHHDLAEGHDASGPGASRDRVVGIGVPLDLPSTLANARERKTPLLGPLARDGLDAVLLEDLGRQVRAAVLVLPIVVRGRAVALLYGDHGAHPVEYDAVGDVVAIAPLLAGALERIIVQKKLAAFRTPAAKEIDPETTRLPRPAPLPGVPGVSDSPTSKGARAGASSSHARQRPVETEPDWSRVPSKKTLITDEDMVDEGWSSVPEPPLASFDGPSRPKLSTALRDIADRLEPRSTAKSAPRPPPHVEHAPRTEKSRAHAKGSGPVFADPPPPATAAAVRALSKPPIPREDTSDGPTLTVGDAAEDDESVRALLDEIEEAAGDSDIPFPITRTRRDVAPESESVLSVDPRAPPSRREGEFVLPAVMVHSDLVDRVIAGGEDADAAFEEILRAGEAVIPAVFAKFPGPLNITHIPPDLVLPRPADCGAVLRLIAAMRRLALPFLAVRSADSDPQVRFWSTYLLGELHYTDAGAALLPRLFDEHDAVRRLAVRSARALLYEGEPGAPIREGLTRMIASRTEPSRTRLAAIATATDLKLPAVAPALIDALVEATEDVRTGAEKALRSLTGQDFGRDARAWRKWWGAKGSAKFRG